MEIHIEQRGDGIAVVAVEGEVDLYTGPQLQAALADALADLVARPAAGAPGVVVDLSRVTFMDSYALGVLVGAFKRHRAAGRGFWVVTQSEAVTMLFRVTGLRQVLPLHPTVEQAVRPATGRATA